MNHATSPANKAQIRQRLQTAVEHLDHVLPGQAPILNFVHHNTLHGYQHLSFIQALEAAERLTGIFGFRPEAECRADYAGGRINDLDLEEAFERKLAEGDPVSFVERSISRREIARIALLYGVDSISPSRFNWQIEEQAALTRFQADVPIPVRKQLLQAAGTAEQEAIQALWNANLDVFGLQHYHLHPEDLTEIPLLEAKAIFLAFMGDEEPNAAINHPDIHSQVRADSQLEWAGLLAGIGKGMTLRGLLLALTGEDILDAVRPVLIRFCASHLDEGIAAWRSPDRAEGLYTAWKRCASHDLAYRLADQPGWETLLAELPDNSLDALIELLTLQAIPTDRWADYLESLALELPGWSGIVNWRTHHPEYHANQSCPASLMDFLAVRLFLDHMAIERLCQKTWRVAGNLAALKNYFQHNTSELTARRMLYAGELPEYLANAAQNLIALAWAERTHHDNWAELADMIWTWKHSPAAEKSEHHTVYRSAWRLFRLAQHLGLDAGFIANLPLEKAEQLLHRLDEFTPAEKGHLWLLAYENHYREQIFAALAQNHGRARWAQRDSRPQAQIIFCMDDREESIRRHLEELNPAVETLGAAGFFGVPMNWRGLDDTCVTPLCPVVVTPAHEVREQASAGHEQLESKHKHRLQQLQWLKKMSQQETRRNLLSSLGLMFLLGPWSLLNLVGSVFFPRRLAAWQHALGGLWMPKVPTRLDLTAAADSPAATPQQPRLGFTDDEQAGRVEGFLRTVGLTSGFAPLVMLAGHGSISQNNPHLAAYDCGACSGRHGGPNARAFAVMANRPEVRALVAERGIQIPQDTWFLGTEHNTCNEDIIWYDLDALPRHFQPALDNLRALLADAVLRSAHERSRRFASAPRRPSPRLAMRHIVGRSVDFSQARPELGHATNASALIGRRSVTRGAFFDRRIFLISYDPTQDPEGRILESILLAAGPVGAGINLEYYFSTVNKDQYGCGTKLSHNVAGMFGVMEGTSSDLRTGLPRQMTEIHEPMRLQLICEATETVLTGIYQRQPALRELIGNGWLLLSAIHPQTGKLSAFDPNRGFIPWQGGRVPLTMVQRSSDWYEGHSEPRPPALLLYPDGLEANRDAA